MTHGSLFSGIGGFDLAAQWMGWDNLFHCEWNQFGQKVLNYYWPDAELFTDITKSDFKKYANKIDILSGGFPCQPYSHAGKRLGKEDERHLWPEMLRAIREIQPTWVVGENVSGLISWNDGLVFDEVQTDLEAEGYEVWPVVLPAAGVGAPHRRDRVWFIAYSGSAGARSIGREINNEGRGTCKDWGTGVRQAYGKVSASRFNTASANGPTPHPVLFGQAERQQRPMGIEQLCEKRPTTNPDGNGHQSGGFAENRPTEAASQRNEQERQRVRANNRGIGKQGLTTNPDGNGLNRSNGQHEINASEAGEYALNDVEQVAVADTAIQGRKEREPNNGRTDSTENPTGLDDRLERFSSKWDASDTDGKRLRGQSDGAGKSGQLSKNSQAGNWDNFPTQPPVCSRNDGIPNRLDGITFSKWRNESIKAYGNAVVPQVVFQIFKAIEQMTNPQKR